MADAETVLVTGGSGYIGGWCAASLLQQGYVVRTTVRDLAREPKVRAAVSKVVDPGNRLSFYEVNLMSDDGWDAAVGGCDRVLHIASPLGIGTKDPDTLIVPAREGAKRAVRAAIKAGVKRLVLTSSVAAASPPSNGKDTLGDETVWTDPENPEVGIYARSKTLAERAAWDLIAEAGGKTSMAVVNPALVLGPVLSDDVSESVQVVERLMTGRVPGVPRLGFNIVDVRDVADLHIRAMSLPEAAGERFIAAGRWAWMEEIAGVLKARLDRAAAAKISTRRVPDFLVRFIGLFDAELGAVTSDLGRVHDFSSAKAQARLGWKPRPFEDTILDCARSLIAEGLT